MATVYEILSDVKNCLDQVPNIETCRIGIENDISPADYPLIRIEPENAVHGESSYVRTKVNILVYIGVPVLESDDEDGISNVYEQLDIIDTSARQYLESNTIFHAVWNGTQYDSENIEGGYRLLCSQYMIVK